MNYHREKAEQMARDAYRMLAADNKERAELFIQLANTYVELYKISSNEKQ
jgi:hypothetical protein